LPVIFRKIPHIPPIFTILIPLGLSDTYENDIGREEQQRRLLITQDHLLLRQAATGSEQAFKALYDKYWHDLFQVAYKRTRDADDARDLVQELFIAFWDVAGRLAPDTDIGAYLFVALRNKIFNYFEKKSVRLSYLLSQPFRPEASDEAILSHIRTREIKACVLAAVEAMPPRMKEIYLLSREQQLKVNEIAGLMGIAPQTVKNQLHAALERIRTQLNDHQLGVFFFLF
jgi:RNA polymerase sigma-70 factor (ECF subfamily)